MSGMQEMVCSTTKQKVIEVGLDFLQGVGADQICRVCIAGGSSCCSGCRSIKHGFGCQKRNTSCTAWLCGFLKFIFYKAGFIHEWKQFWDQVPGKDYREDFTPPYFPVRMWLDKPNIRFLSEAFAEDLQELNPYNNVFWLIEIKETLDRHIDNLMKCSDPKVKRKIEKKINFLTKDFRRFHLAAEQLV